MQLFDSPDDAAERAEPRVLYELDIVSTRASTSSQLSRLPNIPATRLAQSSRPLSNAPGAAAINQRRLKRTSSQNADIENLGSPEDKQTVLYLAYGSNLTSKTFRGARNISPLGSINVHVPTLNLTFDLRGVPYMEPCFANVSYRPPSSPPVTTKETKEVSNIATWSRGLVGVLYELTREDYATVIATEGGGASYQEIQVPCVPLARDLADLPPPSDDVKPVYGWTLMDMDIEEAAVLQSTILGEHAREAQSEGEKDRLLPESECKINFHRRRASKRSRIRTPHRSGAQPSPRYGNLLITGSIEHGLPQTYQDYLTSIETYRITSFRQRLGQAFFIAVWGPFMMTLMLLSKYVSDPDTGKAPGWLAWLLAAVMDAMWVFYDRIGKRLWGEGEKTV